MILKCAGFPRRVCTAAICSISGTDLYKYSPDTLSPIHVVSYHVATDKPPPAKDCDKFWSMFSDNLQPIATRRKKARGTLLVDKHCGNGCSIKRAPLSVSYYNEISGGHIGRGIVRRRCSASPLLLLWSAVNSVVMWWASELNVCRCDRGICESNGIRRSVRGCCWCGWRWFGVIWWRSRDFWLDGSVMPLACF